MNKIRIHNDIRLSWTIYRKSDEGYFPEDFVRATIVNMYIHDKTNTFRYYPHYEITDGTFSMEFPAGRQKVLGEHILYLQYTKEGDTHTIDSCNAFEIVDESCKQHIDGLDTNGVLVQTVVLESNSDLQPSIFREGTWNYEELINKPIINGIELIGDVSIDGIIDEKIIKHNHEVDAHEDIRNAIIESVAESVQQNKQYTDEQIASISAPDVSGQISEHNNSVVSHTDIRQESADIRQEIIDYLQTSKVYTDIQISALIGTAPEMLDTIQELAEAIQHGGTAMEVINNSIATKLGKTEAEGLYVAIQGYVSFTQAEKDKLAGLVNYDDTSIKEELKTVYDEQSGIVISKEFYSYRQMNNWTGIDENQKKIREGTRFILLYEMMECSAIFENGFYYGAQIPQIYANIALSNVSTEDFSNKAEEAGIDISKKVDKEEGKGLSTNDYTSEAKKRLATLTQPTFFDWIDNCYQPTLTPEDFSKDIYQILTCAFVKTNPIDNPTLKIDGKTYSIKINDQNPLKERISNEEICFLYFTNEEVRIFGLDSNRATIEEALNGVDKNKYITPETLNKVINDTVLAAKPSSTNVIFPNGDTQEVFNDSITKELYKDKWYGIEIDDDIANTSKKRIGLSSLHSSLPIQSKMRRCLLKDDGTVNYYTHPNDTNLKEDGTPAILDGTECMVMVEIPAHYRKFETDGTLHKCMLSEYPLEGFHVVPKMYLSAYEAVIDRTSHVPPKLASVVNKTAAFRGGNNTGAWDDTYRSLLGMPSASASLNIFRIYARRRGYFGYNGAGWNCYLYEAHKACCWLYLIEYANTNCQLPFDAQPTAEGYKQGGMGDGVTTLNFTAWITYNNGTPFIPCGYTNYLGNKTGIVDFTMPVEYGTTLTVKVPSYRGIENPFGHTSSWIDGCKCEIKADVDGGVSNFYTCDYPDNYQDTNYDNYAKRGELSRKPGFIKKIMVGDYGESIPTEAGAGSTTYFSDYVSTRLPDSGILQTGVLLGGSASDGVSCGFFRSNIDMSATYMNEHIGTRLTFLPSY